MRNNYSSNNYDNYNYRGDYDANYGYSSASYGNYGSTGSGSYYNNSGGYGGYAGHSYDRLVPISRALAKVLRHTGGQLMQADGYASLRDVLALKELVELEASADDVRSIIQGAGGNSKKRFDLEERGDTCRIRAAQGHSHYNTGVREDALPIARIEGKLLHGTTLDNARNIVKTGLSRQNRVHIHFIESEATSWDSITATSGLRYTSEVGIIVDARKCQHDGIVFHRSSNNVVLTAGAHGILDPKYIERIVDLSSGEVMYNSSDGWLGDDAKTWIGDSGVSPPAQDWDQNDVDSMIHQADNKRHRTADWEAEKTPSYSRTPSRSRSPVVEASIVVKEQEAKDEVISDSPTQAHSQPRTSVIGGACSKASSKPAKLPTAPKPAPPTGPPPKFREVESKDVVDGGEEAYRNEYPALGGTEQKTKNTQAPPRTPSEKKERHARKDSKRSRKKPPVPQLDEV